MKTIVIPDIHGDLKALKRTLREASKSTPDENLAGIIFSGDLIDRGTNNLAVIELATELREQYGERITFQAGNHELACLQALATPKDSRWLREWVKGGGAQVLSEVAKKFKVPQLKRPTSDNHPLCDYEKSLGAEELKKLNDRWKEILKDEPRFKRVDFSKAFNLTRELFLEKAGVYLNFFKNLNILSQVGEHIILTHASINKAALDFGQANLQKLYEICWATKSFTALFDYKKDESSSQLSEIFAKDLKNKKQEIFDLDTVTELKKRNLQVLIHGHYAIGKNARHPGEQEFKSIVGFADINGDVVLCEKHPSYSETKWGFIEIDQNTEVIRTANSKSGIREIGRCGAKEFVFNS